MNSKTHITLQGKGGVGKSVIASMIAQWLHSVDRPPLCIDTDPVNRTFTGYEALKVHAIDILQDDEINSRRFDDVIELIAGADSDIVVDNGAASFVPLSHYLISNNIPALLLEHNRPLVIHVAITGGQALADTLHGFSQLVSHFPAESTEFVVWLNPYWGAVVHDQKQFEELRAYTTHKDRIGAIIRIPQLKPETYGADFGNMLQGRLTFKEVLAVPERKIMERQRLKTIRDHLFSQIAAAAL
jgi:hypothetical protein